MFPTTCARNSAECLLEHGIGGGVAECGTVVCSDRGRSGLVMSGPLMSGVEVTTCACGSCRGFVTLEHNRTVDEPGPALVCPGGAGPVEVVD